MLNTKKQFQIFKKECQKWINKFGMLGWEFHYDLKNLEGSAGMCYWPDKPEDRVFILALDDTLDGYSDKEIKKVAFHEVMEAFLYRLSYLGEARYIQPEEIEEERHHLIRTLENVFFGDKK